MDVATIQVRVQVQMGWMRFLVRCIEWTMAHLPHSLASLFAWVAVRCLWYRVRVHVYRTRFELRLPGWLGNRVVWQWRSLSPWAYQRAPVSARLSFHLWYLR